ncbi:hypothetical protein DSLASN_31010 [Desulfoluna limicola]|uniref:TIGR03545 family protein n=1 Tax=Desulfoluna limicola TaxID=2810562 RepID=A0ABM7PK24_9BACT|nr:hypothetical protein [Desulfoluna limicola]BCS97469.1 hypothetical protein DSLASN_31010 [Desulfoluna limicola]
MKRGMVRITGFFILLIVGVATLWFFRNPAATLVLQKSGETLMGAEVSVEGLDVGPVSLDLAWERLDIADAKDPWKNLVETGPGRLTFAWAPLLKGCFVVESLTAEGVVVGGDRLVKARAVGGSGDVGKTSASLSRWLQTRLESRAERLPVLQVEDGANRDRVLALIRDEGLDTPLRVAQAQETIRSRVAGWKQRIRNRGFEYRAKAIGDTLDAMNYKKAETQEELTEMLAKARTLTRELDSLRLEIRQERSEAASEVARLRTWKGAFRGWVEEDKKRLSSMAHLDTRGLKDVADTLFSHRLGAVMVPMIRRFETLRALGYGVEEGQDTPEPMSEAQPWPRLWVKKAVVRVASGDLRLNGVVTDFSSNQVKAGEPLRFLLEGVPSPGAGHLVVSGDVNCLNGGCRQQVEMQVEDVPLDEVILAPGVQLAGGVADFQATYRLEGDTTQMDATLAVNGLVVTGGGDGLLWFRTALAGALKRVPALDVKSKMTFQDGEGRWELFSNLDAHLKLGFDDAVDRETATLKQGLMAEVERRLRRYDDLLDEELDIGQAVLLVPLETLEYDLGRQEAALKAFVVAVKAERRKRQQAIEEKGMDAVMKLKI